MHLLILSLYLLLQLSNTISLAQQSQSSTEVSFTFDSFTTRNLTLLGDCFIKNSNLGLTRDTSVPATSVGRALYAQPIQFFNSEKNTTASFHTQFSFAITNSDPDLVGDGLAFVIVPDNVTLGSPGKWLGLVNATNSTEEEGSAAAPAPAFIAVEFDSYLDVAFFDINDNHVGVDLGSLHSIAAEDVGTVQGMDLKSGDVITTWIDYNSTLMIMEVRMSYTGQRPEHPILTANFSIAEFANEFMYVGFSASTDGSQELHTIYSWSFSATDLSINHAMPPSIVPASTPTLAPDRIAPAPYNSLVANASAHCRRPFCMSHSAFIGLCFTSAFIITFLVIAVLGYGYQAWKAWKQCECNCDYAENLVAGPRKFTYKELSIATKGFSAGRVIGHGAFGSVYKGILPETGLSVAVKRAMSSTKEGRNEFLAELSIIGCLRHRNLVQLLGWCYEKDEILLVYEYMEQGSLDKLLFNKNSPVLPWQHRYKIVTGVAAALAYLHDECERQVVHRDVKASNIMLDGSFNARLGDFGLAKTKDHNKSPDATLAAGTMGYLAPEYIHTGKASDKTDVFSYGTVVLEVACGRRPLEDNKPAEENVLVDWVWGLYRYGKILEACDKRLEGAYDEEEMVRMLQIGLLCSHPDPVARPNMRQVLQILTGEAIMPPVPLFKPTPSFALLSLPLNLQDIISEAGYSHRLEMGNNNGGGALGLN